MLAEEELNDQGDFRSADRRTELESQVGLVTHGGVVVKEAIESFKAEIIARIEQSIFDFQGIIKVVDALAKKPSERATNKQVQLVGANFQQRLEEVVPKIDDFVALLLTSGRRILADVSAHTHPAAHPPASRTLSLVLSLLLSFSLSLSLSLSVPPSLLLM